MNLPASAVEFLDAFNGAFDPAHWRGRQLPMVHVYTFKKGPETDAGVRSVRGREELEIRHQ
jgi:tRNA (guanine37-N1)-methyltransferase